MALTLKEAISATQTTIDVNGTDTLTNGDMYSLDDEYVLINTADLRSIQPGETAYQRVSLDRGVLGTRKAAHAAAATLTAVNIASGGGGGGVTVTGGTGGAVAAATEIQTPGTVTESSPGVAAIGGTVVVQEADPGAIGAGNLWLQVVFGDPSGDGGYGRLWVRNSDDDGWNSGGPMAYGDATTQFVASPSDSAELKLADSGGSYLIDFTSLTLRGDAQRLFLDDLGVHIGQDTTAPSLRAGSDDPSAGAGVAAPIGSVYLRNTGGVWEKTGAGDTAWGQLLGAVMTLATPIQLQGSAVSITAGDTTLTLIGNTGILMPSLPTADPVVANQLWNDAGTLKVSAG